MLFNGMLANAAGVARLHIGVMAHDGKYDAIQFVAPDFSKTDNPTAPLIAVETYECCVEGCTERTDPRNTMYCTEHFFLLGKGAELYPDEPTAADLLEMSEHFATRVCARCKKEIAADAVEGKDYEFEMFPPMRPQDTEGMTLYYHRKCYREDNSAEISEAKYFARFQK